MRLTGYLAICSITLICAMGVWSKPVAQTDKGPTITVSNLKFEPKQLTVKAGSTVTWENKEGAHTVESDKGVFSSGNLTAGKSFSYKFTKPGRYPYYCAYHGAKGGHEMSGVVVVTK